MGLEQLKAEQAALEIMEAAKTELDTLWRTFQHEFSTLSAAIVQKFSTHGLRAVVSPLGSYGEGKFRVTVPPSDRYVDIHAYNRLEFDSIRRRPGYPYLFAASVHDLPLQTPTVLPVKATVGYTDRDAAIIRWYGPTDNERLVVSIANLFVGSKGTNEFHSKGLLAQLFRIVNSI